MNLLLDLRQSKNMAETLEYPELFYIQVSMLLPGNSLRDYHLSGSLVVVFINIIRRILRLNKQNLVYLASFLILLIAIMVFALRSGDSPEGFKNVTVEEAKKMIEKEDVFILDVRTPSEFNSSHIEGATLIPVTNSGGSNLGSDQLLEARIDEVPENKKILVYCRSGHRSTSASQILVNAGYSQVYNMEGGINAWTGVGYPVVSS